MGTKQPNKEVIRLLPPPVEWLLAAAALGLAYLMGSLALNSGSLLEYIATFILVVFAFARVLRGFRSLWRRRRHGKRQ